MNIHEYQAKSLLKKFGVAVPDGGVAYTPDEALDVAKSLPGPVTAFILKTITFGQWAEIPMAS